MRRLLFLPFFIFSFIFWGCDNDDDDVGYQQLPYTENYINYDGELYEIGDILYTVEPDYLNSPLEGNSGDAKLFYNIKFYLAEDPYTEIRLTYYDFNGQGVSEGNYSITTFDDIVETGEYNTGKYYCFFRGEALENQYTVKGKVTISSLNEIKIEGKTKNNKSFSLHYKSES